MQVPKNMIEIEIKNTFFLRKQTHKIRINIPNRLGTRIYSKVLR